MKIKKKKYKEELSDQYWRGVASGMKLALNEPELAKKYVDDIPNMRKVVKAVEGVWNKICETVDSIFVGGDD